MKHLLLTTLMATHFLVFSQTVHHSGAARNVMMGIDLSATVQLDTVAHLPHCFAVGPVDDLQGEITVFDSQVFTSTLISDSIATTQQPTVKAPFLVYAYVHNWVAIPLEVELNNMKDLENLVLQTAINTGLDTSKAFPFRIAGTLDSLTYHIIMRDKNEQHHSHEAHKKSKVLFSAFQTSSDLVGFYSNKHEGVFTHRGEFIHVHYLDGQRTATGHLDALHHKGKLTLMLPANR
jgi:acetolactate decarboxylase